MRPGGGRSSASTSARPRTEAFWREFLRGLVARGLVGVQLAISDAHPGLQAALAQVLGAPWQRCTVHFLRDCLGHARKDQHGVLAALIRPLSNATSRDEARDRLSAAVAELERRVSKVASLLEEAEEDILAAIEQNDEWLVGRRYLSAGSMEPLLEERLHRHDTQKEIPELQPA